jgi:hypothetical protein
VSAAATLLEQLTRERRYYKLLPQFVQKTKGRYVHNQDDVAAPTTAHLDPVD